MNESNWEDTMSWADYNLLRLIAKAVCQACGEDPDEKGRNGCMYRWQNYLGPAKAAKEAIGYYAKQRSERGDPT